MLRTDIKEPSWNCIATLVFSRPGKLLAIGQVPFGLSQDHRSFSTRPFGHIPPYEFGYPPKKVCPQRAYINVLKVKSLYRNVFVIPPDHFGLVVPRITMSSAVIR